MTSKNAALALAPQSPLANLDELIGRAQSYADNARASSTRKHYARDFAEFDAWCAPRGFCPLPATSASVALFIADLAHEGLRPASIDRKLAAIGHAHKSRGIPWARGPEISEVRRGIRRDLGVAPISQKAPILVNELADLVAALDDSLSGLRDRALLTVGYFGAFRRGELVSLAVEDVVRSRDGLFVTLRRSKTDPEGEGGLKFIPYTSNPALCPVRAVQAWCEAAGIEGGPLFRGIDRHGRVAPRALTPQSVMLIVKRTAVRAGLDPKALGGHSLRAGFATAAALAGKSLESIMRQTLHKSERVARSYIRHASAAKDNAAVGLA